MHFSVKTLAVVIAGVTLYSCNGDKSSTTTTSDTAVVSNATPPAPDTASTAPATTTAAASPEQDFINYAVNKNANEIVFLKAGLAKSSTKAIKEHSTMMLKDHQKLDATVKEFLAKNPSITAPAIDTSMAVKATGSGKDWDKQWVDQSIADHTELLAKLNAAKASVKNPDLLKIVNNTIPVVEGHLSMSKMMTDAVNK